MKVAFFSVCKSNCTKLMFLQSGKVKASDTLTLKVQCVHRGHPYITQLLLEGWKEGVSLFLTTILHRGLRIYFFLFLGHIYFFQKFCCYFYYLDCYFFSIYFNSFSIIILIVFHFFFNSFSFDHSHILDSFQIFFV